MYAKLMLHNTAVTNWIINLITSRKKVRCRKWAANYITYT